MSILEAILLGVVQGVAEFLPVSSSGHLQIAKEMLGVTLTDNLTFDLTLHVATVIATVVILWREISGILTRLFTSLRHNRWTTPEMGYAAKILLSMVPVALVGLLLRDELNAILSSEAILLIVGLMLMLTAALLLFAGTPKNTPKTTLPTPEITPEITPENNPKTTSENLEISWRDALAMGFAQAVAALPGLSRSGSTIATGLIIRRKALRNETERRAAVAQFSFLMVIPPILGEALLDILRNDWSVSGLTAENVTTGGLFSTPASAEILPIAAGFVSAFVVGCLACRFMIEMVKRSRFAWFSAYCAFAGTAAIVWYFM
ncbi:MAG: undecaprenyl-diphosphate phosphatase [Alistipes sp.]|jgi:undecaprenyl-diphosphatase|nr:undecaprenyl-diphosphate phosphatase [Alistipes sp.]